MIHEYTEEYYVTSVDVNKNLHMRTARMFQIFQELGMYHINELGYGDDKTLDKGFLWILAKQRAEVHRMPSYAETIIVRTWTGSTNHMLFPRFYQIETPDGEVLVKASAMWSLLNARTRTLATSDECDIDIQSDLTGEEISLAANPRAKTTDRHDSFTIPFSYIDMNGHMNNTKYFEKAEDLIPAPSEGLMLKKIMCKYATEAMEGSTIDLNWNYEPDDRATDTAHTGKYYIAFESGDTTHVKLQLEY